MFTTGCTFEHNVKPYMNDNRYSSLYIINQLCFLNIEELKEYIECSKGLTYSSSSEIVFILLRSTFVQMWWGW